MALSTHPPHPGWKAWQGRWLSPADYRTLQAGLNGKPLSMAEVKAIRLRSLPDAPGYSNKPNPNAKPSPSAQQATHAQLQQMQSRSKDNAIEQATGWKPGQPMTGAQYRKGMDLYHQEQSGTTSHTNASKTAAAKKPGGVAGGPHPAPKGPAVNFSGHGPKNGGGFGGNAGGGGGTDFMSMLTSLLGQAGTAKTLPKSLADQIAGVDDATAAGFQHQLDHLPAAKKAALDNISNWFGQVTGAEDNAATRDKQMADAGSSAMQDAAKGIMASLGGSAMAGSGQIGAVGANDANTLAAIGANDKMLSSDLAPIFKLSEANAKNSRSQQYDQASSQLQDSLAQAQGQGQTDRANALMQILLANNNARQTNFGNQSGLLNTLASLQISGMNAASTAQYKGIENALHMSEIKRNLVKNAGGLDAMTPQQRADFVNKIVTGLVPPGGKLTMAPSAALRAARNTVRSAGMDPFNKQVIQTIIGPALSNAGVTGPNGGYWPAIYKP